MSPGKPLTFKAKIEIIGINPFVFLPEKVLEGVFKQAEKEKGHIPIVIKIDGHLFKQTLIKYSGRWRLYLHGGMRKAAGKDVGDTVHIEIAYDPIKRQVPMHPKLKEALSQNQEAKKVFEGLSPSLKLEINRYLSHLKTEVTVDKNVLRAINFLLGKERFIGRDKP